MTASSFLDPTGARALYRDAGRLARRTGALGRAKIVGNDVAAAIPLLLQQADVPRGPILDIGCGRGTTTLHLAAMSRITQLVAVDLSPALLAEARRRLHAAGRTARTVCADFHHLPVSGGMVSAVVAAFCLYHSPQPTQVVAELARILVPGGIAVLVTKSRDSYAELDDLVARAGLDTDAARRPSLYQSFHSGSIAAITATGLTVTRVIHEQHVHRFTGHRHVAGYLATSPKYRMGAAQGDPQAIAAAIHARLPDRPIDITSTVSYAVAARS